jgi:hypothetical protein
MKVGVVVAVVLRCSRSLTNVVGRGAEDDQCQALLRVLNKPIRERGWRDLTPHYSIYTQ